MTSASDPSEDRLDALYGLALDEFIPARDRLVRELRGSGERDAAARAKQLRKPSLAAWALNQVSRDEPERIAALLAAATDLRSTQEALLAGGGHGPLRAASAAQRSALEAVTERAERVLSEAGRGGGATIQNKLFEALQAASRDPELGEQLRAGRLLHEAQIGDLGLGDLDLTGALEASAAAGRPAGRTTTAAPASKRKPDPARARRRRTVEGRIERAQAAQSELEQERRRLEREATDARHEAERAEKLAGRAVQRAERARSRAEEAAHRTAELERELAELSAD